MTEQHPITHKSWLCEKCGHESTTHDEYKQHKVDHQLGKITDKPEEEIPTPPPKLEPKPMEVQPKGDPDRKPIQLTYVFTGNCPTCGKHVETLELDVGNDHFCIAFCTACREKRAERKVARL